MSDNLQQGTLFEMKKETQTGPVTCLGLTFENDDERRAYFIEELRKKLPELKKIEGFPTGEEEDILTLSDPPYYTACPNPWINDVISFWEEENHKEGRNQPYHREPFAADVSEGKNNSIYNAHSYHTKVPHRAIMKYIFHYTNPGDIVFDAFGGTGMTGVAAQMCGNIKELNNMDWSVKNNVVYDSQNNEVGAIGERKAIITELSPAASFIAKHYNTPLVSSVISKLEEIISIVEEEFEWVYKTKQGTKFGKINYVVWSDVFSCPNCSNEIVFTSVAYDQENSKVKDSFSCPTCNVTLSKNSLQRVTEVIYDEVLKRNITKAKQVPVLIYYFLDKKRYVKELDDYDKELLNKINNYEIKDWVPSFPLPNGLNTQQPLSSHGFSHVHHFYTKRNLIVLANIYKKVNEFTPTYSQPMKLVLQSIVGTLVSKLVRFNMGNRGNGVLNGTLYVSSMTAEAEVFKAIKGKLADFKKAFFSENYNTCLSVESAVSNRINENSIDYIFTDPPFGSNINYSELNFIWESWLKLHTNCDSEAIVNSSQNKGLLEYQRLMELSFKNYYRVLKPGRWMTVEFSNSQASVWNSIREAIEKAGFVIANVAALDKQQGSFKAVTTTTAVKQDLVISAYKPKKEFTDKIALEQNTEESAWTFLKQHLEQLPIFIGERGAADLIVERTPRILFDRMVAYHVQNGYSVPISSGDFQKGVEQRFPIRDGMAFLEAQVAEYDKKRIHTKQFTQVTLFVSDENTAIEWIRQQLIKKPQTRQDLHPHYMKEIQHIGKHEILPELDALLEQNFLKYDANEDVPSQIHTYLSTDYKDLRNLNKNDPALKLKAKDRWYVPDPNKQADLEKLREKSLLREFETYRDELIGNRKKLKQFRTEAIRAGFKKAWGEKDYQTIVTIGERLPENVLQEDDKLLMYYDNAQIRLGL